MKHSDIEKIVAFLIKNTRTRNRTANLYDIAMQIETLRKNLGSLKKIEKDYSDISANMLNRFLSVLKVDPEIVELVKERKIDNINAIYYLHTLSTEDQKLVSKLLVDKRINSSDIRVLRPLKKRFPNASTKQLIEKILRSKDIREYLVKFDVTQKNQTRSINKNLSDYLSVDEYTVSGKNKIGTIRLTTNGIKKLRECARTNKKSFKQFLEQIILN